MRNMRHTYRCFGSPLRQGNTGNTERRKEEEEEEKRKKLGEAGVLVLHSWCEYRTVPACQAQICSLAKIDRSTNARLHLTTVATHGILFLLFRVQLLGRNAT
jgi:dissimilatory sulfite reductase (desulfoviridin) alpha/beta subunit